MELLESVKALLVEGKRGGILPREVSPLGLAYIGDAIFEIFVRTTVLARANAPVNKLHKQARDIVNAKAQAEMYRHIAPHLTEEEFAIFKRGRNAKSFTTPKNMDLMDYRHATGLEALFGFLYLDGKMERAFELFQIGLEKRYTTDIEKQSSI